jgi:hypothetical protein
MKFSNGALALFANGAAPRPVEKRPKWAAFLEAYFT